MAVRRSWKQESKTFGRGWSFGQVYGGNLHTDVRAGAPFAPDECRDLVGSVNNSSSISLASGFGWMVWRGAARNAFWQRWWQA